MLALPAAKIMELGVLEMEEVFRVDPTENICQLVNKVSVMDVPSVWVGCCQGSLLSLK